MAKYETPAYETALDYGKHAALESQAVQLTECRDYGWIVLRVKPQLEGVEASLAVLGLRLPSALGMTGSLQTRLVQWISPDEFLITVPLAEKDELMQELKTALTGIVAAVVDNSGGYVLLQLSGAQRYALLAKTCPYDLVGQLPVAKVVSTVLAKANVVVYRTEPETLYLLVRSSFADYVWKVLAEGALAYSAEVSTQ